MENSSAKTPSNLLGMEHRVAYANRKYHSGLMRGGITNRLVGVKFSGSPNKLGENSAKNARAVRRIINPMISLYEK